MPGSILSLSQLANSLEDAAPVLNLAGSGLQAPLEVWGYELASLATAQLAYTLRVLVWRGITKRSDVSMQEMSIACR